MALIFQFKFIMYNWEFKILLPSCFYTHFIKLDWDPYPCLSCLSLATLLNKDRPVSLYDDKTVYGSDFSVG